MNFAGRSGKEELLRVAEALKDQDIPDKLDGVIGTLALTIIAMVRTSAQDEAYRLMLLAKAIGSKG